MDYRKKLIVEPGSKVSLKKLDPGWHGQHENETPAEEEIAKHLANIAEQQRLLYGEKRHALLIVLQGIDAAGKDGVCWHVIKGMNPQGVSVTGFKQPTPEELLHDFLWRVHPHAPGLGKVAVFNRSHYEDVLAARVHKIVPKSVWEKRYERINEFENLLHENGVTIIKFFLMISPEEQLKRFGERLEDPMNQWKISNSDYTERALWNEYINAFEEMMEKCSTKNAPWYILPSNHKWFRNLAASQIIASTLQGLRMKLPKPIVDIEAIKSEFHSAKVNPGNPEKSGGKLKKKSKPKKAS